MVSPTLATTMFTLALLSTLGLPASATRSLSSPGATWTVSNATHDPLPALERALYSKKGVLRRTQLAVWNAHAM